MAINEQQKQILLEFYDSYQDSLKVLNEGQEEDYKTFDEKRVKALPIILELVKAYISKKIGLEDFKVRNEDLCRKLPFWGFKSFSGQMQINQYTNNISDKKKDDILRNSLKVPENETEIREKINKLSDFLSEQKESSLERARIPRVSQIYLLSYF